MNDADHLGAHPVIRSDAYAALLRKGDQPAPDLVIGKAIDPDPETPVLIKGDTVTFVGTSSKLDRDLDIIRAAGVETANWEKRPVILASHDATKSIGVGTELERRGARTIVTMDFYPRRIVPLAGTLKDMLEFNLARKGLSDVGAVFSIGFRSIEAKFDRERGGVDFSRIETLEFSLVAMAANPAANLISAKEAKAAGIDLDPLLEWAEQIHGKAGFTLAPTAFLEGLLKTSGPQGLKVVDLSAAHAASFKYMEPREALLETEAGTITKIDSEEIPGETLETLETEAATGPVDLVFWAARKGCDAAETKELMAAAGYGEFAENLSDPKPASAAKEQAPENLDHLLFGPVTEASGADKSLAAAITEVAAEIDVADLFAESHARITGKLPTA